MEVDRSVLEQRVTQTGLGRLEGGVRSRSQQGPAAVISENKSIRVLLNRTERRNLG